MFFDLNINNYISYMKREFFGSAIFFTFLVGVNYILKNMYDRYSDDTENKRDTENETVTKYNLDHVDDDNLDDDNLDDDNNTVVGDVVGDVVDNSSPIDVLDSVIKIVLDTKIEDDIEIFQKVLDRKQYLLGLTDRLSEIRERLEDLKNELITKS